jgi:hypothetical protein
VAAQPIVLQRDQTPQGVRTPTEIVTRQTVQKMCEHIRNAPADPLVKRLAAHLSARATTPAEYLIACWTWTKHNVKFVHDDTLIRQLLNECDHFELLISPPVLLRMNRPQGDCDDFTMLLCALALARGFDVRIVTLACDRNRPGEYSHVFGAARLPDSGLWCAMDASHGTKLGWQVPPFDVQRRTEWDMNGQPVSDQTFDIPMGGSSQGLHGLSGLPVFDTGLPVIGTVDLSRPLDWLTLGGALASLALMSETTGKIAGAAGFLGVRYMFSKAGLL